MKLPGGKTLGVVNIERIKDPGVTLVFRNLMRGLEELYHNISRVVNGNEIDLISQDDQPTPDDGQTLLWVDTDATAGQPKAYIVTNRGGVVYTFASQETV